MKRFKIILFLSIVLLTIVFFYKTFLFHLLPFPGDLLIAEYQPWKGESFLGYVPGSYPNKAQYFDTLSQMIPWKIFSWNQIRLGIFPLWNPHNFSGTPHAANIQAAVFYPFSFLGLFLPYPIAWTCIIVIQPLLAMLFMALFMGSIGVGVYGTLFAAFAYAFSQYMSVFLEYGTIGHVILWLPLSLWTIERYANTKKSRFLLPFSLSVVFSAFAGHLQLFIASILFICAYLYFTYQTDKKNRSLAMTLLFVLLASLGISALQLIPTIELAYLSARSPHEIGFFMSTLLIQPKELVLALAPDLFGNPATRNYQLLGSYPGKALSIGLAPLAFALAVIFTKKARNRYIVFFMISGGILLLLLTRNPISWLIYHIPLPGLLSSSPNNMQYILSFSLSVLAGFGIHIWIHNPLAVKVKNAFLILTAYLAGCMIVFWAFHIPWNIKNAVLSLGITLLLLLITRTEWKKPWIFLCILCILLLTIIERFYFFQKFNPFTPPAFFYPPTQLFTWIRDNAGIDRFWGYGYGSIPSNTASGTNVYDMQGYDPLYSRRYGEFIGLSSMGTLTHAFNDTTRSNATIAPGFGINDFMKNSYRLRILDLGSVRYILDPVDNGSTEQTFPPPQFQKVASINNWNILQSHSSVPKVYLVSDYIVETSPDKQASILMNPSFNPKTTVVIDTAPSFPAAQNDDIKTATIRSYNPNSIEIETQSTSPAILVLTDTYYPGWYAYIDEVPANIIRANYTYRAVFVPSGNHIISMQYDPLSLRIGIIISACSFLCMIGYIGLTKIRHRF